jgi:hypothetical protein
MFIHRKQKSAETEIRCTKANHSAHTVIMCLLPVYRTTISATRSHNRNDQLVWREGRSGPKDLRSGRRTLKINPKVHYNNTGYLFWLTNMTSCFCELIHFVVSWVLQFILRFSFYVSVMFHFVSRSVTVYTPRAPKYVAVVSFPPHEFACSPCRYYWFLKIKIRDMLSTCDITFVLSFVKISQMI